MKIAFTDFVQPDLELEAVLIADAGLEMAIAVPHCTTSQDVIDFVKSCGADAILSLYAPMTEAVFEALPDLRIVSVPMVGVDAIDITAAKRHGVWIAHVPDAWVVEVGVHAAAMALSLVRHLPFHDRSVRARQWNYAEPGKLHCPHLLTFGLLGCGRIGQQAARCAAPSFGKVIAHDPFMPAEAFPAWIELAETKEALFEQADVISLHCPLTADTRRIVDADLLNRLRPGSYIVNTSRGALIDPADLLEALDSGRLGGAALDVFEVEPPDPDDPLLHHPRTLVSPHAAFYSVEADEEGRARAVRNVITYAHTGRPDHYVVEGTR